jgi:hypothetical protein
VHANFDDNRHLTEQSQVVNAYNPTCVMLNFDGEILRLLTDKQLHNAATQVSDTASN